MLHSCYSYTASTFATTLLLLLKKYLPHLGQFASYAPAVRLSLHTQQQRSCSQYC